MPMTLDEAYYISWSKFLGFGYFDHPPMIAFLLSLAPQWLNNRLLTIGCALLTLWLFGKTLARSHLKGSAFRAALLFIHFNLASLALGIISTPDTVLTLFWALSIHEAYGAISGNKWKWLSTGLFCGLGLLSKYTMVVMAFVLLFAGIRKKRNPFKTVYPYLGGLLAFMIYSPNLFWNYQEDWVTYRFQLNRRLAVTSQKSMNTQLPLPMEVDTQSNEYQLGQKYLKAKEEREKQELLQKALAENLIHEDAVSKLSEDQLNGVLAKVKKPDPFAVKAFKRVGDFLGGQLAFWGGFLLLFLVSLFISGDRKRYKFKERRFFATAALAPICFFGLLSPFQKIEPNWGAMYLFGATPFLAYVLAPLGRKLWLGGVVNIVLLTLAVLHAHSPFLPIDVKKDRLLKESFGFEELASYLSKKSAPIFVDKYQDMAMLSYYQPNMKVAQWPGITRPSEYLRSPHFKPESVESGFWLLTTDYIPPRLQGFQAQELKQLKDCRSGLLKEYDEHTFLDGCESVHTWFLTWYLPSERVENIN